MEVERSMFRIQEDLVRFLFNDISDICYLDDDWCGDILCSCNFTLC